MNKVFLVFLKHFKNLENISKQKIILNNFSYIKYTQAFKINNFWINLTLLTIIMNEIHLYLCLNPLFAWFLSFKCSHFFFFFNVYNWYFNNLDVSNLDEKLFMNLRLDEKHKCPDCLDTFDITLFYTTEVQCVVWIWSLNA